MIDKHTQIIPSTSQRGFSLVEVLIALIILSVGMLGIASLYVQGMQAGRTSLFRHNAVTLAGDVADRIRANPTAISAYAGVGANNGCIDGNTDCSDAQMAGQDILLWDQQAIDTLPAGDVAITVVDDGVNPPVYTIAITWKEPGVTQNYTITTPVPDF